MNRSFLRHTASVLLTAVLLAVVLFACESDGDLSGKTYTAMRKSAKRGVAFNFSQTEDLPLLSESCSWAYNWGNSQNDNAALWFDTNDMDFCPMAWSGSYDADKIRAYKQAHPNTRYLLAFNEPNLTDQANMTPAAAAAQWPAVVALADELGLKLVSPAMNYGTLSGYSDPIKWLDEFFAQPGVSIDDVDAIAIHCYMASPSAVQSYVKRFEKYDKPIWMTEFCAWESTVSSVGTQMDYMCTVLNYFEQTDLVERYAWFIPRTSGKVDSYPYMQLLTHTSPSALTDLGVLYAQFSSFDHSAWLPLSDGVGANQYIALKNNSTSQRVADGKPYIYNLRSGEWLNYQVQTTAEQPLQISYASLSNSIVNIYVDDVLQTAVSLPRTGDVSAPTTLTTSFIPKQGRSKMRFEVLDGALNLYRLKN